MQLQTTIKPRADGTVTVEGAKKNFEFKPDANGDLTCDVDDEQLVERLLCTGNFHPVNESDFDAAEVMLRAGQGEGLSADDDDVDDDEGDMNALPVEGVGAGESPEPETNEPAVEAAPARPLSRRRGG